MSLAICGTGTGIGKTIVSAIVLARYQRSRPLAYWKPIATGAVEGSDRETVQALAGAVVLPELFRFDPPVSPHLAARWAEQPIDLARLVSQFAELSRDRPLIVEGIGGVLVPLTDRGDLFADLLPRLDLPALIVASSALGTINHTLLTLEALRTRGTIIAGVVLVGALSADNKDAIERFGSVEVIAEVPPLEPLDARAIAALAERFDPDGRLEQWLERRPPADWPELDRRHVWHPYTQAATAPAPIPIARAEGVYLETIDGRRLLDGISSWWVNLHGHAHPRLGRAIAAQSRRLAQIIFAGLTHEPASRLAAELVARAPAGLSRVFYSDDGSTSVEVAMKIALQSWRNRGDQQRRIFVALEDGYHGDTFGAMAAGSGTLFHRTFRDLLLEVIRVRTPSSQTGHDLGEVLASRGSEIAAVLIEPMLQGAGGMKIHPASFLREVRALTAQHQIPLIADEVLTGFGRTGRFFACEHAGIAPDLLCLSKGITGGALPLGATLATEALYRAFLSPDRDQALFHGHSYTANALACAAALESLKIFDEERRLDRVKELEQLFLRRMARLARLPGVDDARVLGAVAALDLADSAGYLDPRGPAIGRACLERGLLVRPLGGTVYFMPPLVISDREAEWAFDVLEEALTHSI